jgi:hypothetical protein
MSLPDSNSLVEAFARGEEKEGKKNNTKYTKIPKYTKV